MGRPWTQWEDANLARMARAGQCAEDIGELLGRTAYAVRRKACQLGVPLPRQGKPNLARQANLLDFLALCPGATFAELARALGCAPQTAWKMLRRLAGLGLVEPLGRRKGGRAWRVRRRWAADARRAAGRSSTRS